MKFDKPYWTAFYTFFANMAALFLVKAIPGQILEVTFNLISATIISLFTALAVYGKAMIDRSNGG
jgi:hypothetical protein